ncbi:hypothetical protein HDU76_008964, partial [Blyttiomyces sp. JEL0837]
MTAPSFPRRPFSIHQPSSSPLTMSLSAFKSSSNKSTGTTTSSCSPTTTTRPTTASIQSLPPPSPSTVPTSPTPPICSDPDCPSCREPDPIQFTSMPSTGTKLERIEEEVFTTSSSSPTLIGLESTSTPRMSSATAIVLGTSLLSEFEMPVGSGAGAGDDFSSFTLEEDVDVDSLSQQYQFQYHENDGDGGTVVSTSVAKEPPPWPSEYVNDLSSYTSFPDALSISSTVPPTLASSHRHDTTILTQASPPPATSATTIPLTSNSNPHSVPSPASTSSKTRHRSSSKRTSSLRRSTRSRTRSLSDEDPFEESKKETLRRFVDGSAHFGFGGDSMSPPLKDLDSNTGAGNENERFDWRGRSAGLEQGGQGGGAVVRR